MKKRILCVLAVLLTFIFSLQVAFAQERNSSTQKLNNQKTALENADRIEKSIFGNRALESSYAGVYLNKDGNLVVNYTGEDNIIQNRVTANDTIYKKVSNNLQTLNDANEKFQGLVGKYGIESVELSIKNNCVIVTYKNDADLEFLNSLFDAEAVQFKKSIPNMGFQFTTNVINGNSGGLTSGSNSFTIGCRAKSSSTGKAGVLIPGHIFPDTDTDVYYNGGSSVMGTTKQTQCSGKVDATFVQTKSSYKPTLDFADGDSYEYTSVDTGKYGLREGLTVHLHGSYSGKTEGEILSTSFTANVGGISMTNLVKCDYVSEGGDSGGAVTYDRYIGSATSRVSVMGLQSLRFVPDSGTWTPGSSFSCFSRIDYIYSALNLTDY
ncbi:MAG: hypothetical protein E7255_08950 [Lachnospiraceae bacterium]|jgi:hypothetical protein|nr:hypothetical protein [Lachnospiraceae bacterium]